MAKQKKTAVYPTDLTGISQLMSEGRLDAAKQALGQLLQRNPLNAVALRLMGDILRAEGVYDSAIESYQRSISIQKSPAAIKGMLDAAEAIQRFDVAASCLRELTRIEPGEGYNHFRLALILKANAKTAEEAVRLLQKSIDIGYQVKESYYQIGCIAQVSLNKRDLARTAFLKSLEIDPGYIDGRLGLANLYCENNHIEEAIKLLQTMMDDGTEHAELFKLLGVSLLKLGRHKECLEFMRQAANAAPDNMELLSNYLFMATYTNQLSPQEWLAEHERFGVIVANQARPYQTYQVLPQVQKRLRIGFVSGDFKAHSVNYFFEPLLQELDRSQFEVFCYFNNTFRDQVTDKLQAMSDGWRDIALLSDELLARQIHDDKIDILIDLSVHSAKNRLSMFAWCPAPVQISWLGYPATTGVSGVDYIALDRHYLPPAEHGQFCVEKPLLLNSYRVFRPHEDMNKLPIKPLPAMEKGYVTFGSFNDFIKIDSRVLNMWVALLERLPTARLAMIVNARESLDYLKRFFTDRGITEDRLLLFTKLSFSHFLQLHYHVDVALDTYPFTGLTTSMHGLWMGVPAITLAGARTTSRSGLSLLAPLGLDDFVATTEQEYLDKACFWAENLPLLAQIRAGLREKLKSSVLMDEPAFARDFEAALHRCWQDWCSSNTLVERVLPEIVPDGMGSTSITGEGSC